MKFEKMLDGTDIKIWDFSIDLEKSNTERELDFWMSRDKEVNPGAFSEK